MPRFLGWRYLLPSFGLFGAIYAYEYVTWTSRSKESALKSQFIRQMRAKLSTQIRATSNSYTSQMSNNLSLLLDSLHNRLETTQQEVNNQIAQLTQEQTKYSQLQDKAKKLRYVHMYVGTDDCVYERLHVEFQSKAAYIFSKIRV